MRLNLGCGLHPLDGFVNLDAWDGWRFEHGLGQYDDGSVEAITVSHALMYVHASDWPAVFAEFARVLAPSGVVRITEDSTADEDSERFGGYPDAVTLTTPRLVCEHLEAVGLPARPVPDDWSGFRDDSLIQRWHGSPPKVFHVEGVRA